MKNASARVIQETWYCFKYRKLSVHKSRARSHRRRLLGALRDVRKAKVAQRKLYDEADNLATVAQEEARMAAEDPRIQAMEKHVNSLHERIDHVNHSLLRLTEAISDSAQHKADVTGLVYATMEPISQKVQHEYRTMTPIEDRELFTPPIPMQKSTL